MDGRGRLLDNIFIERLWRSLKYEAVYLHELRRGLDAERIIGSWIDFYNEVRPHSSLAGAHRAMPTATARTCCERCMHAHAGARPRESGAPRSHPGSAHPGPLAPTATAAHIGACPSPAGKGSQGGASTPREHIATAPEGSHNHSVSTLTLPSDCPAK